ncbi:serine/threonine protein kinase [Methanobrevibacter sp. 87.7]|uniref:serine protein kinase RIO n=1 Tax=Methanobrevibacter sp. 87.7 TaxID=387957 RepID=UPI000B513D0A|nr:serine protein kinase RIO [Methanobrevibacter sp. 87.7]OWT32977.1 serine/threonine protein kinase [Methanobrevibacter sp. 87.7]
MDQKIAKADKKVKKIISEKRKKDADDRKVGSDIFDKRTLETLYKLANKNYIDILNGEISTGKEANVLKGIKDDKYYAVKIYRIATSDFKKMNFYVDGDHRFRSRHSNKRQLINSWVSKEYKNLERLYKAGVKVPKPITSLNNVLILEFIGDDEGNPAKTVKYNPPKDVDEFLLKVLNEMYKFINNGKLIHGDLSAYNIMNLNEEPVIIDVSQSVIYNNPIAKELLDRDINNLTNDFKKLGSKITKEEIEKHLGVKDGIVLSLKN